ALGEGGSARRRGQSSGDFQDFLRMVSRFGGDWHRDRRIWSQKRLTLDQPSEEALCESENSCSYPTKVPHRSFIDCCEVAPSPLRRESCTARRRKVARNIVWELRAGAPASCNSRQRRLC